MTSSYGNFISFIENFLGYKKFSLENFRIIFGEKNAKKKSKLQVKYIGENRNIGNNLQRDLATVIA